MHFQLSRIVARPYRIKNFCVSDSFYVLKHLNFHISKVSNLFIARRFIIHTSVPNLNKMYVFTNWYQVALREQNRSNVSILKNAVFEFSKRARILTFRSRYFVIQKPKYFNLVTSSIQVLKTTSFYYCLYEFMRPFRVVCKNDSISCRSQVVDKFPLTLSFSLIFISSLWITCLDKGCKDEVKE